MVAASFLFAVGATSLRAQEVGSDAREDALRVFLDCQTFRCDRRYFRTEITFVNWTQEPQDAQVHIIFTSQELGGGGREWQLDFIGREELAGRDDELVHRSDRTDTDDEVLQGVTRVMAAGLARYAALAGLAGQLDVSRRSGEEVPDQPPGLQGDVDDPWDYWVFEIDLNGNRSGEEQQSNSSFFGRLEADRITEDWKIELSAFGHFNEDEFEVDDSTTITSTRRTWNSRGLVAYSLAEHWSVATDLVVGANTFFNQDLNVGLRVGVEYSFFPYQQATRRRLTALWMAGARHVDYEEITVFGKTEEEIYTQTLRLNLNLRQPWGEANVFGSASHFLDDLSKNELTLGGGASFRIFRGFTWNINGNVSRVRNQVFLSAAGVPEDEVLLRRRALATDFRYRVSTGFGFSFGSIYNNVVNNRFN